MKEIQSFSKHATKMQSCFHGIAGEALQLIAKAQRARKPRAADGEALRYASSLTDSA